MAVSVKIPSKIVLTAQDAELVAIQINTPVPTVVACLYIPPHSPPSLISAISHHIQEMSSICEDIIILGDLNHPLIDWSSLTGNSNSGSIICDCFFNLNLSQLVTEPTHTGGNVLDIVATNNPQAITSLSINSAPSHIKSDDLIISFAYESHTKFPTHFRKSTLWLYSKTNLSAIKYYFDHLDPLTFHLSHDANLACNFLSSLLLDVRMRCIPHTTLSHSSPKWFNTEVRHRLNCIHTLRRRCKKHPSPTITAKLAEEETKLLHLMEKTKSDYESKIIASRKPAKLYSYLRHLSSSGSFPSQIYTSPESSPTTSPLETAETFNNYFHSIFSSCHYDLPPMSQLPTPSSQLHTITIDQHDVVDAITSLDIKKAFGCDDISPHLIKICAEYVIQPLTNLFQLSVHTTSIPQQWKVHKIVPIHKKGDRSIVSNYRPISLLCSLSRVLESIIYHKVADFIRPLLSSHQYGFLPKRSCLQNLLLSYLFVTEALDHSEAVDAIYLDFSKAFDTIPHSRLLYKLWRIGITGPLWLWFKDYLSNRHHYVEINGTKSNLLPVLSGVPQGSVLGPLLFLIYIDDLPNCLTYSLISLFADDTKLLLNVTKFNDANLQSDLHAVLGWCDNWDLKFNLDKCYAMHFSNGSAPSVTNYSLGSHTIQNLPHISDLGIQVNNSLSFEHHYKSICNKAYQCLYMIRRSLHLHSAPTETKKQLYLSLVRSKLTYCSQLWRPLLIKHIIMLENVQRRATKFITNDYSSNYKIHLQRLHLLPLMYWLELQDLLYLIKNLQYPSVSLNIYNHVSFVASKTRRNHLMLKYKHTKSSIARHFYFNRVVKLWNAVQPVDLNQSFHTIKHHLINLLWRKFETSFDPDNICSFHFVCPCNKCHHIIY